MKKISIFLTAVLLIAGVMTTSVTVYAAENKPAAVTIAADDFHSEQELLEAKKLAAKLEGQSVEIVAQFGIDGKFFGSVTSKDIANAIESKFAVSVDKRKIEAPEIKKCGNYSIRINLYTGVVCRMTVVVE